MTPTHPTVTELLLPLSEIDDRGVYFEDSFTSWRDHIRHGAAIAAALRERLDPARPPHVGVLLQNTPFFSATLVAGALSGIVPVGLNPVRRGAALAGDIAKADCQLVLTGSGSAEVPADVEHINVDSPEWTDEVAAHRDTEVRFRSADLADLFMLIFTSGTSGDPKAVKCSHRKVAIAGVTITQRFSLGRDDVCYVSMPLFHSNAVLVGWAVAAACQGSMALRRKFSASQFLADVRRYGATYANYVGKPLSYVLATPELPDDADNPLRAVYGNEGVPGDIDRFGRRFGCVVMDGFGSTEGGVAITRTLDTPAGAWAHCRGESKSSTPTPANRARQEWSANWSTPPGRAVSKAITTTRPPRPSGWPAASTTVATSPIATTPATPISPVGSATGCESTVKI